MSLQKIKSLFRKKSSEEQQTRTYLKSIIGYHPRNYNLFRLASIHHSAAKINSRGVKESNERLEYLGDAILGSIIAEYLFKKYPYKEEGFLTEIRSRIVNRESLNQLGQKLGLREIIILDKNIHAPNKSVYGDTLEALIGAVYLDRGFGYCREFVIGRLVEPYFNIDEIISTGQNAKSKIIEWAQKENKNVRFNTVDLKDVKFGKEFTVEITLDNAVASTGYGRTKKKAEQDAAKKAIEGLNLE